MTIADAKVGLTIPEHSHGAPLFERSRTLGRLHAERFGVIAILMVTLLAAVHLLRGGMLIGQDSAIQFYPWYSYLGEQLRSGNFPGWSSAQFSGAPFAADPQSGWTYLPAMLIFTALPIPLAAPVFVLGHLLLAAGGTYALTRVLGMPIVAASVAAVSYELTGPIYSRSVCCPAALEVAAWVPAALLGTEVALQARGWQGRLGGWTIAGLAISQVLAAWLGQGSYYLLLAVGSFIAYRTVLSPDPDGPGSVRARAGRMFGHGAAVFTIGFGLAAAGMLPRLAYVARSNVANGEYAGQGEWASVVGGAIPGDVWDRLFLSQFYYPGVGTLALALLAIVLAQRRYAAPYFVVLGIVSMILSAPRTTPIHEVLYATLPRFEALHSHWPERVMLVGFIAPSVLAGALVSECCRRMSFPGWSRLAVGVPAATVISLAIFGAGVPTRAIVVAACVAVILWIAMLTTSPAIRHGILACLVIVVAADLLAAGRLLATSAPYGGYHRVDLEQYFDSSGAADFLREETETEPARFFGYDPAIATVANGYNVPYRYEFAEPMTQALLVNNRATLFDIQDVQGYNPVQPQRYVDYITALNGHGQEYHDANIFESGLDSPLLNLLNARYIVVPNVLPPGRTDLMDIRERHRTVYVDEQVRVLENAGALPRAWIVHSAQQTTADEALAALASGAVDPRTTALLEESPPPLVNSPNPTTSTARIATYSPDFISVVTQTSAGGLLVLSEVFDPDWKAYVNGKEAPIYRANHLFRAVEIPASTSTVEFRYEVRLAFMGALVSGATVAALLGAFVVLWIAPPSSWRRPVWRRLTLVKTAR